jgi:hypothetical protein
MQIWVDVEVDTVRDVLHSIQHSLYDKEEWRQDYDGLFQVRNNHFSQLIHILNLSKYGVQPHELWVAKPWSMSAKTTVGYAGTLLNYLKGVGCLQYMSISDNNALSRDAACRHHQNHSHHIPKPKCDDSVLVLTREAKSRMYVPGGVLKHHHAYQFLSFSPAFGPMAGPTIRVDVLGADVHGGNVVVDDVNSQLSDSHCGGLTASLEGSSGVLSFTDLINTSRNSRISTPSFAKSSLSNGNSKRTNSTPPPCRTGPEPDPPIMVMKCPPPASAKKSKKSKSPNRGFVRALSMLNCSNCKSHSAPDPDAALLEKGSDDDDDRFGASGTILGSTVAGSPLWQVWEEEGSRTGGADSSCSIVSESAPLLIARLPSHHDWIAEI